MKKSVDFGSKHITPGFALQHSNHQFAKTFGLLYRMKFDCKIRINMKNYYIHWLALHPESSTDLQLPYDDEIPPAGSELYNDMSFRWASFTEPVVSGWRKKRWDRHGIKNPIYDQYLYFHNSCKIHEFIDIKSKMDEIGQYLMCNRVWHAGSDWREAKASTLTSQLTTMLGIMPQLIARLVQGRWCLYEWKFKLTSALELSSFPYNERHIGGFSDDDYILF